MSDEFPRGRFIWHELLTTDPEAARAFYTEIVGWGTAVWEGEMGPYQMFARGETPYAGVMQLPDEAKAAGAPPHWLPYVAVPDVDAAAARTEELGGCVMVGPMEIPTVGRMAVLGDPQGATFAVYRPESDDDPGHDGLPEPGEFSWHELATTDWEAAFAFYADLFGWDNPTDMDMGEMGTYRIYGRPGTERPLGGMFNKPAEAPGPPYWLCYVRVEDVHRTVEAVKAAGGQVLVGPMEVPGEDWIAQCLDPQGGMFAVHHVGAGPQA